MIFKVDTKLPEQIHHAAQKAEKFLHAIAPAHIGPLFPFTYVDNLFPSDLWDRVNWARNGRPAYPVQAWYPGNPWTKAIATTFGDGAVHLNVHKITETVPVIVGYQTVVKRRILMPWKKYAKLVPVWGEEPSVHNYVNTLVHESMHNFGFSHGSGPTANYVTKEKLRSVPYALGALAEQWSREGKL